MRDFGDGTGQLISYFREDRQGPVESDYRICQAQNPSALRAVLEMTLGVRGEVVKTRQLYFSGRTRIHLDHVEGLGHFVELEVVLGDGDDRGSGIAEAERLMHALDIRESDLVSSAYIDLISPVA